MLDAGSWMLDAGSWIKDSGCWILDVRKYTSYDFQQLSVSSLPGRSFERAKTGNQYPGSNNSGNGFHSSR